MDRRRVFANNIQVSYAELLELKKKSRIDIPSYKTSKPGSIVLPSKQSTTNYEVKLPPFIAVDGMNSYIDANTPFFYKCSSKVGSFYPYGQYVTQYGAFRLQNG